MGLLKAVHGALGSVMQEQWKEIFWCDSLNDNTLLVRAHKQTGARSANTRQDDDVLTNGSVLCVADGQSVLVVKQGKVVDVCSEPGEHIFHDDQQAGLKGFFKEVGKRVSFGGGDIQPVVYRVYYLNTKEITGIRFHSPGSIPFRQGDGVSALDLDGSLALSGCFSYRVSDPVKLYKSIIGNVSDRFDREEINFHMRKELEACMSPALSKLSQKRMRPSQLPGQIPTLCDTLRELMNEGWCGAHGFEIVSLALDGVNSENASLIQSTQHASMLRNPEMAAAVLIQAETEAIPAAAKSRALVVPVVIPVRFSETAEKKAAPVGSSARPSRTAEKKAALSWRCACGNQTDTAFCPNCGKPRSEEWVCECGQRNASPFCRSCGRKKQ